MKKILNYFNWFEWLLIIGIVLANYITGGLSEPIGAICAITGVLCVVLVAKGKISNFFFGVINVALYIFIAWNAKFYGEFMLNLAFYLPVQFIGYYKWKKKMNGGVVEARTMNAKQLLTTLTLCAMVIIGYAQILTALGGNSVYLDSTSTILSVVAQILMFMMFAEQWVLWIIVNIVSIGLWVGPAMTGDASAVTMVLMWSGYLINSVYGYWNWKRMAKDVQ